jgi:hypothetical protein
LARNFPKVILNLIENYFFPGHSSSPIKNDLPEVIEKRLKLFLSLAFKRFHQSLAESGALHIEDDPSVPSTGGLPNFKVVIRDALDFGVKGVALAVQLFASDSPLNLAVSDPIDLAALADEPSNIEERQKLTQPCVEQRLGISPGRGYIYGIAAFNRYRIGDQSVKRFSGCSEKRRQVGGADFDPQIGGMFDLTVSRRFVRHGRRVRRAR